MSEWDGRGNNFDFLRLSLAVLVIYSHAFPLGLGTETDEPFRVLTHGQVTGGAIAVDSFFIMSGFLIAASAQRSRTIAGFLRKRFARIYPAFLVCTMLTVAFILPLSGGHFAESTPLARLEDAVSKTLRLLEFSYRGSFAGNPFPDAINGSTWSIAYEFWCYLGVALLSVLGVLRRRWLVLAIFIVAWIVGILFRINGWILGGKLLGKIVGPPQIWARLLPLYLAGVVFYLFRERIPLRNWIAGVAALAMIAASWFSAGWTALFPIAGAYLLFWLAFTPVVRLHRFGRFGDFSYGTYLYAFPVEQMLMRWHGGTVQPIVLFASATPITLLLAVASWYGVERHFLAPSRRKETVTSALD